MLDKVRKVSLKDDIGEATEGSESIEEGVWSEATIRSKATEGSGRGNRWERVEVKKIDKNKYGVYFQISNYQIHMRKFLGLGGETKRSGKVDLFTIPYKYKDSEGKLRTIRKHGVEFYYGQREKEVTKLVEDINNGLYKEEEASDREFKEKQKAYQTMVD